MSFKKASPDYLLADTTEKRERGLSGVDPSSVKGMLFVFPSSNVVSFHNKDCLAPIAIKWMNNLEVVGEALLPKYDGQMVQVTSPSPVNMVLEQFAQLRRTYDYGEGPYSNMQDTKSIQDYLQKRRRKRASLLSEASCLHGNKIKVMVENKPLEYCLDCQEILSGGKDNRGDWNKQYFDINVAPYNDIGAPDARAIDKIDFYS